MNIKPNQFHFNYSKGIQSWVIYNKETKQDIERYVYNDSRQERMTSLLDHLNKGNRFYTEEVSAPDRWMILDAVDCDYVYEKNGALTSFGNRDEAIEYCYLLNNKDYPYIDNVDIADSSHVKKKIKLPDINF